MTNSQTLDFIRKRWELSKTEKSKFDHIIYSRVMDIIKKINPHGFILIYWSRENEVDTLAIIDELLSQGYKVCLIRIDKQQLTKVIAIDSVSFPYEYWNDLRMPLDDKSKVINKNMISIMILPVAIYDNSNQIAIYESNQLFQPYISPNKVFTIALAYGFSNANIQTKQKEVVNLVITNI